jgi:hypothetical protein
MSRAQLKKVFLDVDFFSNPKIEALGYKFGSASQACLIEILCAMSRATNAQVDEDLIYSKIHKHQVKEPSNFFDYLIEKNIIFKDGNGFSNGPVIKDQENYARKLESSNARVTRYREKKEALPSERETRTPDTDSDNDNEYDLNINKEPELRLDIAFIEFGDLKTIKAIERWKKHRLSIGKTFDQMALDSLQSLYAGRANELADDIDHSISNGWKTLNAKSRDAPRKEKKSTKDTIRELYEEALLEEQNAKN